MVDTETGVLTEKVLKHEGNAVREFYAALERPVVVGIEATGAMQWFLELLEELGIECRGGSPRCIGTFGLMGRPLVPFPFASPSRFSSSTKARTRVMPPVCRTPHGQ
jgi:hypothetical protein